MPNITVREYHPESGELLGNISILDFGGVTSGTHSKVKVLDLSFSDVSSVGNVKLGIVSNGGVSVKSGDDGHFGIVSSPTFSAAVAASPLSTHFSGLNTTGVSSDTNNSAVGNKSSTISDFVYLDIEISSENLKEGNGAYKVFFDYS
jgi:hypothetical protein